MVDLRNLVGTARGASINPVLPNMSKVGRTETLPFPLAYGPGRSFRLIENIADDDHAQPFDITLAIPNEPLNWTGNSRPQLDLVALVTWAQAGAHSDLIAGRATRVCEVDWVQGVVISVPGSSVTVDARWDNIYPVGGGALDHADSIAVAAFLTPKGSAHGLNPQRTLHFYGINPGASTGVFQVPAFAKSFEIASYSYNVAGALRVHQYPDLTVADVNGGFDFPVGVIMPAPVRLDGNTAGLRVYNIGDVPIANLGVIFHLAL